MPKRIRNGFSFGPGTILMAHHDGEGWCIRAEPPGKKLFLFGGYADTMADAHWAAGEVAKSTGAFVHPMLLN
jgi:hypothetical protein